MTDLETRDLNIYTLSLDDCPVVVCAASLPPDRWGRTRMVSGRGLSSTEAEQRCRAEAMERLSAIYDPSIKTISAPYRDTREQAVDPRALMLISEAQYRGRAEWNRHVPRDHWLPDRFDDNRAIDWVEARRHSDGATVLVPAAAVFLGFPKAAEQRFPVPDSSGLASGDNLSDAVDRGFLELAERDAAAIWWYNSISRPECNFGNETPEIVDLTALWQSRQRRLFRILDLSHDLGVAVTVAVSCGEDGRDISLGFGAGWTITQAAASAVGEMVQFELTKRLHRSTGKEGAWSIIDWANSQSIRNHPFLLGSGVKQATSDLKCENRTAAKRELLTVDVSRYGNHTVRAIVPGLRPIWPRFAPGRLYEVPKKLGWLLHTAESNLNSVPIIY